MECRGMDTLFYLECSVRYRREEAVKYRIEYGPDSVEAGTVDEYNSS